MFLPLSRFIGDDNFAENQAKCLATGSTEDGQVQCDDLLDGMAPHRVVVKLWCDTPDVITCQAGELTGPAARYGDGTEDGQGFITAAQSTVEAAVSSKPHTV
jgi:hypothetical protein